MTDFEMKFVIIVFLTPALLAVFFCLNSNYQWIGGLM